MRKANEAQQRWDAATSNAHRGPALQRSAARDESTVLYAWQPSPCVCTLLTIKQRAPPRTEHQQISMMT